MEKLLEVRIHSQYAPNFCDVVGQMQINVANLAITSCFFPIGFTAQIFIPYQGEEYSFMYVIQKDDSSFLNPSCSASDALREEIERVIALGYKDSHTRALIHLYNSMEVGEKYNFESAEFYYV